MSSTLPLTGLRVIEVAAGVSAVGAGLAASLPGSVLRDLGADVARVRAGARSTLDDGVEFARSWDRGKEIVDVADGELAGTVATLAREADVVVLAGPEALLEGRGVVHANLARDNERLVTARIRPAHDAAGPIPDHEILLHARTGLMSQLRGNRPGPVFCDAVLASAGAGLTATVGALAQLFEREGTGVGGWVETSLYDGVLAILPMIIGAVEHASPSTRLLWEQQGPSTALTYRCADGEYLQLWFGAKGAYEGFLEHMGDPPSEAGYTADTMSGAMDERSARWAATFMTRERSWWLHDLAGHDFRCEPVLRPGEGLGDAHVREVGLRIDVDDPDRGAITVLGPVCDATPVAGSTDGDGAPIGSGRLLSGVRVLDLSAYLAGPVAPQILGELGADVVKVEPPSGDAHRGMEPLFAAGQRGKRAIAVDLKSPEAGEVLRRLFRWSDVVHHNSRVGLAERLGYDESKVRDANPAVVYSHASGFGSTGPHALLPANDYLMQALSGMEAAIGGFGGTPTFNSWGSIDVTGGWVSACAILAGLYARRRDGVGRSVTSTLLGAGMLLKSGAFVSGDGVVEGPLVDVAQTGYGAAYRIYRGADGEWFAVVVPDVATWAGLRRVVGVDELPDRPPALRTADGEPQPVERVLERAFATRAARSWVGDLRSAGVPVELVLDADRRTFISRLLDDPVNRQLGRVAGFDWGPRGWFEQPAFPIHLGPEPRPPTRPFLPALGEHTAEILAELGDSLATAGSRPSPPRAQ